MPEFNTPPEEIINPQSSLYDWYENTVQFIHQIRASAATSGSCPRCQGKGTIQDSIRSVSCSQCDLAASVAELHAWDPKKLSVNLNRRLDSVWKELCQLKYDIVYKNVDLHEGYDKLVALEKTLSRALETLKPHLKQPYVLMVSK